MTAHFGGWIVEQGTGEVATIDLLATACERVDRRAPHEGRRIFEQWANVRHNFKDRLPKSAVGLADLTREQLSELVGVLSRG